MAMLEEGSPSVRQSLRVSVSGLVREEEGDLFRASRSTSLAHCVSSDMKMGAGIALLFRKMFGCVDDLIQQKKKVGEVAYLKDGSRYIFYLVTKKWFYDKPTETTLLHSLLEMKSLCQKFGVRKLAMPRIGCGLDGLNWQCVFQLVQDIFSDTDLEVTIYSMPNKANPTLNKTQERFQSFFESRQSQSAPAPLREMGSKRKTPSYSSEDESDTPKRRRKTVSSSHESSTHSILRNNLDTSSENGNQRHATPRISNICKRSATNKFYETLSTRNDSQDSHMVINHKRRTVIPCLATDEKCDNSKKSSPSVHPKSNTSHKKQNEYDFLQQIHDHRQNCVVNAKESDSQSGGWTSEEEVSGKISSYSKTDKNAESAQKKKLKHDSDEEFMRCNAANVFDEHMSLMGQKASLRIMTQSKTSPDLKLKRVLERDKERQSPSTGECSLNSHILRKTHELSENSDDADEPGQQSGGWTSEEEVSRKNRSNFKEDKKVERKMKKLSPKDSVQNHSEKSRDSLKRKKKKLLKSSKDKEKKSQELKKKHKRKLSDSSESDSDSSQNNVKSVKRKALAMDEDSQRKSQGSSKSYGRRSESSNESDCGPSKDASYHCRSNTETPMAQNRNYSKGGRKHEGGNMSESSWDVEETTSELGARKLIQSDPFDNELVSVSKRAQKSKTLEKFKSRLGPVTPATSNVVKEQEGISENTQISKANVEQDAPTDGKKSKLKSVKSRLGLFIQDSSDAEWEPEDIHESHETATQETIISISKKPNPSARIALLDRLKKSLDRSTEHKDDVPIVKRRNFNPEHASLNILKKALNPITRGSMYSDREHGRVSVKARLSLP